MAFADVALRHLIALRTVAAEGTFGRAATRLGYSQSAVSQQIAALERALGAPVFDRPGGPRPVTLTPVGELLVTHAATLEQLMSSAESDVERLLAGELGTLTIGTFQSVSVSVLPTIIERLRREYPEIVVELVESDDDAVLANGVLAGSFDLAFLIEAWGHDEGIECLTLYDDPFILVSRIDEATAECVPFDELVDAPLIGQPSNHCQRLIDQALRANGVEPNYVFTSSDNAAVQAMVRAGMGDAVMPLLAVDVADPRLCFRQFDPPIPPRRIQIGRPTGRTMHPAAETFISLTREVFGTLSDRAANLPIGT